jgi:hypothetical protein
MDFYQIRVKESKEGLELYPDFMIGRSQDLMVQGRTFYAIWDEENKVWSRDEFDVQRLVDEDMEREAARLKEKTGVDYKIKYMRSFNSNSWKQFRKFLAHISDNSRPLDSKLIFANQEVSKTDYATKKLPYDLVEGDTSAWEELLGVLYSEPERAKIEWTIGSVVAGDSKRIQKFAVFYGSAGTGKSTVLNIIEKLFVGYTTTFDGKALGSSNAAFATEVFRNNPLVAIQHDGDLSKIEDNTRLNSIISHEMMPMNEKYKPSYTARAEAFLFMGTNQPVKITDAKSGIIRRLIDVHPTGVRIPERHYHTLMSQIDFELGAIAHRCLQTYLGLGKNYYSGYRPLEMMLQTDVFFNFVEANYGLFKEQDKITLKQAYGLYKEYCSDSGIEKPMPQYKMREELRNYFDEFKDRGEIDGEQVRSLYAGFSSERFKAPTKKEPEVFSLVLDEDTSLLDVEFAQQPAQLASKSGTMYKKWSEVSTTLLDIDTHKLHWVRVPKKHIVIDFDLKDQNGSKALERNLEAASEWPPTYAELSKSGEGVHLHYTYEGETADLANSYSDGIEVKTFHGDASLRRQLSKCNAVPISSLSSGLPKKEMMGKVLKAKTIKTEKGLRELIERNLKKEIHPGTKPSIDFIAKILEEAHESEVKYDLTDMRSRIVAFANNSTNQAETCLKVVQGMKFSSENELDAETAVEVTDDRMVLFDVEVYPNLFVICWKYRGGNEIVKMINPKPHEVAELFRLKLVGFFNRRYDNHILYAASLGYDNAKLFKLSQKIIVDNNKNATFAQAYNISYADIWEFSSEKQGLKKWEIDLGIHHMELDIPWDEPVDEKDWDRVIRYCENDVLATEKVLEDRWQDFIARQILAELSGLTVNDTTQRHTAKIVFGDDKNPQQHFVYTDLSKEFDGYKFELGKSYYRGEEPGEGGYVYAEPGIYSDVALLDVASMHPATIERLNMFGKYTKNFSDIKQARIHIKRRNFEEARKMLDGRLAPYLDDEDGADKLAYALKIAINIVYGLTSAKFDNPFRDVRNKDNIAAKRGALFMVDLKKSLQDKGQKVVHIKTDSIKIPNPSDKIVEFVMDYGHIMGYEFEHEGVYEKFCLVNDAVYIAKKDGKWDAVGAQFQHPYVFKSLFSKEEVVFDDYCEGRSVLKGTMYLGDPSTAKEELDHKSMRHLGKTGLFVPVEQGGGRIYRVHEDKYYAVSGTKGYLWVEAEVARHMDDLKIDMSYFEKLKEEAIAAIEQFGSFDKFVS